MVTKKILSENVISSLKFAKKYLLTSILALSTVSIMAYAGQQSGVGQISDDTNSASPSNVEEMLEETLIGVVHEAGYTLPNLSGECADNNSYLARIFHNGVSSLVCKDINSGPASGNLVFNMYNNLAKLGYTLPNSNFACESGFTPLQIKDTAPNGTVTQHTICRNDYMTQEVFPEIVNLIVYRSGYSLPDTKWNCVNNYDTLLNIGGVLTENNTLKTRHVVCQDVVPSFESHVGGTPLYSETGMFERLAALGYALPSSSDFNTCRDNFSLMGIYNESDSENVSFVRKLCLSNSLEGKEPLNREVINEIVAQAGYTLPNVFNKCLSNDSVIVDIGEVVNGTVERHGVCKQIVSNITPENKTDTMFNDLAYIGYTLPNPNFVCQSGYSLVTMRLKIDNMSVDHYLCENDSVKQREINEQLLRVVAKAGLTLPDTNGQCTDENNVLDYVYDFSTGITLQYGVCKNVTTGPVSDKVIETMFFGLKNLGYTLPDSNLTCHNGFTKLTIDSILHGFVTQHYLCKSNYPQKK